MLMDFPQGFGFDPTVAGVNAGRSVAAAGRKSSRLAHRREPILNSRKMQAPPQLPVVLVRGELVSTENQEDGFDSPLSTPSPFLTTALVGFILAGAGYFVGFH